MSKSIFSFVQRLLIPSFILLAAIVYFMNVRGLANPNDRVLIEPVFWLMVIGYFIIAWQEWQIWTKEDHQEKKSTDPIQQRVNKKIYLFMICIALYLLLLEQGGFILMTLIFLPVVMRLLGTKAWKLLILLPLFASFFLYLLFVIWLGIPLPKGQWMGG